MKVLTNPKIKQYTVIGLPILIILVSAVFIVLRMNDEIGALQEEVDSVRADSEVLETKIDDARTKSNANLGKVHHLQKEYDRLVEHVNVTIGNLDGKIVYLTEVHYEDFYELEDDIESLVELAEATDIWAGRVTDWILDQ